MNILIVAHCFPMPDRQTGALRFWQILKSLAMRHRIIFCGVAVANYQENAYGKLEVERYRKNLESSGIEAFAADARELYRVLRSQRFDVVLFEHYKTLHPECIDLTNLRFWQPRARIIVDTVDVEYQRLMSRALITRNSKDWDDALEARSEELAAYAAADLILTTSDADKAVLEEAGIRKPIESVPLFHPMPELAPVQFPRPHKLLFVGNFELDANVDAMVYFTSEIFPLIKSHLPDVRLVIAGNGPPDEIKRLADVSVDVLGYVPDLIPIYADSSVVVVPVRWGGGLKGKIIEAMSLGLPVVASDKGLEGFGLTPDENVMFGAEPESFAAAVIDLFSNQALYEKIRLNAWRFVNERFSELVINEKISWIFDGVVRYPINRMAWTKRAPRKAKVLLDRYVLWRFAQPGKKQSPFDLT